MPMKLIDLQNAVFTLDKRLQKRNGYAKLTALPSGVSPTTLTTFNGNLTVLGNSIQSYNESNATWVNHGRYQPVRLSTLSLVRASTGQTQVDAAISGSLVLTVFVDSTAGAQYQISDSNTSQQLKAVTNLPITASQPRVFVLGNNFIITYIATVSAAPHLQYIAVPVATLVPASPVDITTQIKTITSTYDGMVADGNLYLAWEGSDGGGAVRLAYVTAALMQSPTKAIAGHDPQLISVSTNSTVTWVSWYETSSTSTYAAAFNVILNPILTATLLDSTSTLAHVTSAMTSSANLTVYGEVDNDYSFTPNNPSNYVQKQTITQAGVVGSLTIIARSVGLASKPFTFNDVTYVLTAYQGEFQPTYFLIDGSGSVVARLASGNGGGYATSQVLPSVTTTGNVAQMAYLIKDLLAPVSKSQGATQTSNIYSQTGVSLVSFDLSNTSQITAEVGNNLNITGGFLWAYDGTLLNEQGFHLWPEDISFTGNPTGGDIADGDYFYYVTYEWTDAQGNLVRSAPSVPTGVHVAGGGGTVSVTLHIPTLRLTYKPDVRIVIYRWGSAQQIPYQITSITSPTLNDPTMDSIDYIDTVDDAAILGNLILYTTGGVVENLPGPATANIGLYKSRLMLIPSEDQNLVWYSKQVLEATPVEMSDLFTVYAAPTISSQGSTGPTLSISAMDDKFIAFKKDAIYYLTGTGPDNTGASNDFSDPTFITSTVGCSNQQSIVFTPNGLVFQSDKGQWLLGRGLETLYIGAPVEQYNNQLVTSSVGIPGTNQIRLCLDNKKTLMYDYYFDRWGTFTNTNVISSCLYTDLHTYLTSTGDVFQETPNTYLDNGSPVLMAFTTAWMNLMGLQGFQRAYLLYILGNYISPHTLNVTVSYDYNNGPVQNVTINPSNFAGTWGSESYWGDGIWGGPGSLEQWRIFLQQQKMQAFQITVQEAFDPTKNTVPGAGLTFSGLNLVVGAKKGFVPLPASNSVG